MGISVKFGSQILLPVGKDYPSGSTRADLLTGFIARAIREAGNVRLDVCTATKRIHDGANHFCTLLKIGTEFYALPALQPQTGVKHSLGQTPVQLFKDGEPLELTYAQLVEFIKTKANPKPSYRRFNLN